MIGYIYNFVLMRTRLSQISKVSDEAIRMNLGLVHEHTFDVADLDKLTSRTVSIIIDHCHRETYADGHSEHNTFER